MALFIPKDELQGLIDLTHKAEQTPVIAMSLADGLSGRDFSAQAWENVRAKWQELGRKYGFNPTQVRGIDPNTGEVFI